MVRTLPLTSRNRNRINNKSRLRIVLGNFDADSVIPDEDDERHRLQQSVLGVDQDDANEHHLQVVLTEAAFRASSRGPVDKKKEISAAYIPTPDSTGVASNYEELYPTAKWKDPTNYVHSSSAVEECLDAAIANGFTYYMDERDKEWLDKNNEAARGEGTSAQAAAAASKASSRSAKAKGKEPEGPEALPSPIVMTEDEFELIMGLFEKATHEKTEFLHHSLETGMTFPQFSEYNDVFSSTLPTHTFASFQVPSWIPPPEELLPKAKVVYPHWKTRRLERRGHRIIPTLNFDETDTPNESYVCFRRRELKAVRKTRATQVTTSDKLTRLQAELETPLQLVDILLGREKQKQAITTESQAVWHMRYQLVELRRKNGTVGERGDEQLLFDKERPVKKSEPPRQKLVPKPEPGAPSRPPEQPSLRPSARVNYINANMEALLTRQKEKDHNWEDYLDCGYQATPGSFASRLFKYIPPSDLPKSSSKDDVSSHRPVRLRYGRGGRLLVDRRRQPSLPDTLRRKRAFDDEQEEDDPDVTRRLVERWKYDMDDNPSGGPWAEEQDRVLVDDYDHRYIRWSMTHMLEQDHHYLNINPTLIITNAEGGREQVVPYRLGMPMPPGQRPHGPARPPGIGMAASLPLVNGAPVAISQQMKMLPNQQQQVRVPSNGSMQPPPPVVATPTTGSHSPAPSTTPASDVSNPSDKLKQEPVTNGIVPASAPLPDTTGVHQQQLQQKMMNGHSNHMTRSAMAQQEPGSVTHTNNPNGYHHMLPNGYSNGVGNAAYVHHLSQSSALTAQQMQNLKSAFQDPAAANRNLTPLANANTNFAMPNGGMNLKLPPARQMQWNGALQQRTVGNVGLGMDMAGGNHAASVGMNGVPMVVDATAAHGMSPRTPRNGVRLLPNGQVPAHHSHSLSPHHSSPSPIPMPSIAQSQTPPRPSVTPVIGSSPSSNLIQQH